MKKAVAIFSGGMDSATLAYLLMKEGYEIHLLSFNYGQRHKRELDSAHTIYNHFAAPWMTTQHKHDVLDITPVGALLSGSSLTDLSVAVPDGHYTDQTMKVTVVPNRNAIMLSIAYGVAVAINAEIVATGVHAGDHAIYPDCRPEFITALEKALQIGNKGFGSPTLYAPFLHITKADIARIGDSLGVPFADTWSCYKGKLHHCGKCGTCVERKEAFEQAGLIDPTPYYSEE